MKFNNKLTNCIFIFIACTFLLITCSSDQKKRIKSDQMVNLMSEIMTIENLNLPDSTKAIMILKAFKKKNISLKEFEQTIKSVDSDPEYWYTVYNKVKDQLKESQQSELSK